MSESLQSIVNRLTELEDAIVARGGEVPPGSDLEAAFEQVCTDLMVKVDNYAEYIVSLEARAEGLQAAAKKVLARAKAMENLAERLKSRAGYLMGEKPALEGECFSLKRKKNPPKVEIIDDWRVKLSAPECIDREELPNGTYEIGTDKDGNNAVYILKINKDKLAEALKAGKNIEGATLSQGSRIEVV